MAKKYNFKQIEKKWSEKWEESNSAKARDFDNRPKHYNLVEFPYPSGSGLHVGHCMGFGASDAYCRMKRMQGYNVLYPIGWDAFGLPTENYAIKTGIHPAEATLQNVENFRKQMKMLGLSFDYDREVDTTDPDYYRWTQWIFLQFYKHAYIDGKVVPVADEDTTTPRMAYQTEMPINWCPSCKIGLANEEVIGGKCERCGAETTRKMQKQWMLRITAYADRLIDDLDTVEYLPKIKQQQINWIGRSTGSNIKFKILGTKPESNSKIQSPSINQYIEVFTTRADTLYGCTYLVLAPEHNIISNLKSQIINLKEVEEYIDQAKKKSDLERTELQKEKTGVKIEGIRAVNPINGKEIDVYVADYVLANYGTGAVMAVPAHDERDYEFAKKYGIEIIDVIMPKLIDEHDPPIDGVETVARTQVCAIVVDPKKDKILALKFKKFPWLGFVVGGVEGNESLIDTAKREILEETGYKNVKFVKELGGPIEVHFHAAHKGVNRKATYYNLVFELVNQEQEAISEEETEESDAFWSTWEELYEMSDENNVLSVEHDTLYQRYRGLEGAFTGYGVLYNSGEFDGMESGAAIQKITEKLRDLESGDFATNYKLRDWLFSRQHYWGEPIPIIYCKECAINNSKSEIRMSKSEIGKEYTIVPVPEEQLPVTLPEVENYQPTDTGESPLASITEWVNVKCPVCGGEARRETDTMPNWAGSSWYFLAYILNQKIKTQNPKNIFVEGKNELDYWMPVDLYNGGMEHTTLHLLYSRFWHKFLYDLGMVSTPEPYKKRIAHGIILGPDGQKMSKSKGNVINPDDIVKQYGADATRAYIMFIGPYDQESAWNTNGLSGVARFLNRVWDNHLKVREIPTPEHLLVPLNKAIKGITEDIESYSLNTYIAKLMEFNNLLSAEKQLPAELFSKFIRLLSPACPFMAEELWELSCEDGSIETSKWPDFDTKYLVADEITVVVQINGKVRAKLSVASSISDEKLKEMALHDRKVQEYLSGKEPNKVIVVPRKLVSIVV